MKKSREPEIDYDKAEELYNQGLRDYAAGHLRDAVEFWKRCLQYNPYHKKAKANIIKTQAVIDGKK